MTDNHEDGTGEIEVTATTEELDTEKTSESPETRDVEGKGEAEKQDGDGTQEVEYYDVFGDEITEQEYHAMKRDAGDRKHFQADYSRKTQALAEDRKTVEQQKTALAEKTALLADIEKGIEQLVLGDLTEAKLNDLIDSDPAEYLRAKKRYDERQAAVSKLAQARKELQDKMHAENYQRLHSALEWDTEGKKDTDLKTITAFAQREGVTQEEFSRFTHPAIMKAFVMAEKYLKLQDDKPEITKRVVKAPKIVKPGAVRSQPKPKTLAERMYGAK